MIKLIQEKLPPHITLIPITVFVLALMLILFIISEIRGWRDSD